VSGAGPTRPPPATRRRVAVLGATGAVGQTFIRLLANHPWFELAEVAASDRSAGRPYAEAVHWLGDDPIPPEIAGLSVLPCSPDRITADVVFSALDSSIAGEAELAFAAAGRAVLSNAKNHRMEPDVPLVIAEVNPGHLHVLEAQRRRRGWPAGGGIVTNGNCATIVAAMALAPIHQRFGITKVFVATMQAVSGAGYPGVPSLDILGNVIPFIGDEEAKIEGELPKFLGRVDSDVIRDAPMVVTAHANRVAVADGHTVCLSVSLERPSDVERVAEAIEDWRGAHEARGLPSAPERPLFLAREADRPQPRRDANAGNGMSVVVGRVRSDPIFDIKLVAVGHNVVRGAAGASILNAELLVSLGLLASA
jgi:aspartate-semialdehyde dehydrogenase